MMVMVNPFLRKHPASSLVSFITVIFLFSNSCKNENQQTICNSENTVKYPENASSRFYFKDSSYWIYQDSLTGTIDSAWVEKSWDYVFNGDDNRLQTKGKCYQEFGVEIKFEKGLNFTHSLRAHGSNLGSPFSEEIFATFYSIKGNDLNLDGFILKGDAFEEQNDDYYGNINLLDSVFINNKMFYKIIHKDMNNASYPSVFEESYYAKSIGLLKYKLKNGSIWNLIRYRIIQ